MGWHRHPGNSSDLQSSVMTNLRDLYSTMDGSQEGVTPTSFLAALRRLVPQFNEMAQGNKVGFGMRGYAQQGINIPHCPVSVLRLFNRCRRMLVSHRERHASATWF